MNHRLKELKEWLGAAALTGLIVLLAVFLSGCATMLLNKAMNQGENLTPEQIRAYKDSGHDVYGCFVISGPPPAGSTIWVVVPKGAVVSFKFGDNCHLIQ